MKTYEPALRYIGTGEYIAEMEEAADGEWAPAADLATAQSELATALRGWKQDVAALRAEVAALKGDRCTVCDDDGLIYIPEHGGEDADEVPQACPMCDGTKSGYASAVTKERDEARAEASALRAERDEARANFDAMTFNCDRRIEERDAARAALDTACDSIAGEGYEDWANELRASGGIHVIAQATPDEAKEGTNE